MYYFSSRDRDKKFDFLQVALKGLSPDGGLFIPDHFPDYFNQYQLNSTLRYDAIAFQIIKLFSANTIADDDLEALIAKSYQNFHADRVQIKEFNHLFLAELFHGPTYSFKDYALQFLANLFEYSASKEDQNLVIVGATSGDTGSAAIHALKGKKNIKVFMLYPHKKISSFQENQMTCIAEDNIFPIAVEGDFDDCQKIVKLILKDQSLNQKYNFTAINSINWVRIVLQIVYYFYLYSRIADDDESLLFSIPSGNFGNAYAGFVAQKMGLPIEKLIVATNENDILHRVIAQGEYKPIAVVPTITPSMDIQVASNFERILSYVYKESPSDIKEFYNHQGQKQPQLDEKAIKQLQEYFSVYSIDQEATRATIKKFFHTHQYILDPHSAVALKAAENEIEKRNDKKIKKIVTLCTAHPMKFAPTINETLNIKLKEEDFSIPPKNVVKAAQFDEISAYIQTAL